MNHMKKKQKTEIHKSSNGKKKNGSANHTHTRKNEEIDHFVKDSISYHRSLDFDFVCFVFLSIKMFIIICDDD